MLATSILSSVLIHNAIITDLNFTLPSVFLLATFFLYSKLSHLPTCLLLETSF